MEILLIVPLILSFFVTFLILPSWIRRAKKVGIEGIDMNKYPKMLGGEIDSFMAAINELQKKYLHKIQKIIFAWNFK